MPDPALNSPIPSAQDLTRQVDSLQQIATAIYHLSIALADLPSAASVYTVAALPSPGAGQRAFVSNSNATLAAGLGNIVVGGGANFTPVYADGSAWRIG